ncbi:MAG: cytochrome c3 family protein [Arenicella sp.]|nr:cytochrome c3 family protein [Arenicella sp.]
MNEQEKHKLSLDDTGLSKRKWSWVLFVLVLALFLIVPMLSLISDDAAKVLRNSPLPSDNAWISGHLSDSHKIPELNQNCDACHVSAFEVVQDNACIACHEDTNHHFDTSVHDVALLDGARCASCHIEHDEPSNIISKNDALCIDCHADMSASGAVETDLSDVASFGREMAQMSQAPHPSFSVSMLVPEGGLDATQWSVSRVALSDQPQEVSNLVFPHKLHMDPEGLDAPDGERVLACNDCHVSDDAGMLMQPVTMENNCRTCHALVFDPNDLEREVPHGDPDTVLLSLEEYYSRQFLRASLGRNPTSEEVREFRLRRPGKSVAARAQQALDLDSPWGKANSIAQEIFERTTCKTCHEVTVSESPDHLSKWRVEPIKLTKKWMPKSEFNHFSHRTSDCALCHAANDSEQSADVLMPDLELCETCHTGSTKGESKVPSNCISCHQFHLPSQNDWRTDLNFKSELDSAFKIQDQKQSDASSDSP